MRQSALRNLLKFGPSLPKLRRSWVLLALLAIAGAAAAYRWSSPSVAGLDIQTSEVQSGEVRRVVSTSGAVRALVTVEVGSQLSGMVSKLNVDFSAQVKEGDVLARIEPATFETKVREAEAAVAIAKATVALQEATVTRAQANLRKAERDFNRVEELASRGTSSTAQLDAARAGNDAAEADLAIAKAQVENARATLVQREAALESSRIDLERTFIRSPIDGVVIERSVEVGQTVAASLSAPKLFTIAQDLTRVQIDAQVDEADIGQVAHGNAVTFRVDAYPEMMFSGKVQQIRLAPISLQNVVTYTVVIHADNPAGRLLPGMTANVEIVTGAREGVLTVANESLRFSPRGPAQALARDGGGEQPSRGNGNGRQFVERMLERLSSEVGLKPEEMERVRKAVTSELADLRSSRGQGTQAPSADEQRELSRARVAKALRATLTPDQFRKYEEMQRRQGSGPRRGTVWTLEGGQLVPHQVRLGLADGNRTEVVEGLKEGDRAVLRVREKMQ